MRSKETEDVIISYFTLNNTVWLSKSVFDDCNERKRYGTHVIDENRSVLDGLEEWRVGGILEVASVLLK